MRSLCVVLAVQLGCYHRAVTVSPDTIAKHSGELRSAGVVTVQASAWVDDRYRYVNVTLRPDSRVQATVLDPPVPALQSRRTWSGANLTVEDLLDQCPPHRFKVTGAVQREFPYCPLAALDGDITVGHRRFSPVGASALVVLGALAGLGACAYACDRPYSRIAGGTLIAGGAVLVGVAVVFLVVASAVAND